MLDRNPKHCQASATSVWRVQKQRGPSLSVEAVHQKPFEAQVQRAKGLGSRSATNPLESWKAWSLRHEQQEQRHWLQSVAALPWATWSLRLSGNQWRFLQPLKSNGLQPAQSKVQFHLTDKMMNSSDVYWTPASVMTQVGFGFTIGHWAKLLITSPAVGSQRPSYSWKRWAHILRHDHARGSSCASSQSARIQTKMSDPTKSKRMRISLWGSRRM